MAERKDTRREELLKEYDYLRAEIISQIDRQNNLQTFTITTVVAILSLALSQSGNVNPYLFLIPFCILIPMSSRIANYRFGKLKISAYMSVFLESEIEGYNWETRTSKLNYGKSRAKRLNLGLGKLYFTSLGNVALGAVSALLFYYFYFIRLGVEGFAFASIYTHVLLDMNARRAVVLVLPMILMLLTTMASVHFRTSNDYRLQWMELWREVRDKEHKARKSK